MSENSRDQGQNQTQNSGISAAAKFNPHLWSPEELRAIFVVRQRELAAIVQNLRDSENETAPQHLLITGQRGMGKSTLLQRVALAVEDDPALFKAWLPLRFPEEQYTVSTPAELWTNVIGALADALERQELPTIEIDAKLADIAQMPSAAGEAAALSWLEQWCAQNQRRLLLLVDSTDLLFSNLAGADANKRTKDGGASALWRVRKVLSHAPHFFWLGGSYQPLETEGMYSDAFLDFFQLIELRPLTLAEMQSAILAMAAVFGAGRGLKGTAAEAEVSRLLSARPERLRAMRQLTGGNPRTTVMLYELFAAGGKDSVRADLERLLDVMTPLYKARLEVLADQPRKVLAHVMEHWAPITANALASAASMPVSSVSTQLTRLEQEGLIEKTRLSGTKRHGFQSAERFFNIWYLMRNAARGARARVGWLVEFMRLWYSGDELKSLATNRIDGHKGGRFAERQELEYSRAIASCLPEQIPDRRKLEWLAFKDARKSKEFGEIFELSGTDATYAGPDDYLKRFEALDGPLRKAPLSDAEKSMWVRQVKCALHLNLAEKEAVARRCEQITEVELSETRNELNGHREEVSAEHTKRALVLIENSVEAGDFFPDCPDSGHAFTQMLNCFEDEPDAFFIALELLIVRHKDVQAELACRKGTEIEPGSATPWILLGEVLSDVPERVKEAEEAYRTAIKIDSQDAQAWACLGVFLARASRFGEAENAFKTLVQIRPDAAESWHLLGLASADAGHFKEAESAFRQAIAIDPNLGSWQSLARVLADEFCRFDEAELAFRKAIEIDSNEIASRIDLAELLGLRLNRAEEAIALLREATTIAQNEAHVWHAMGRVLYKLRQFDEAEAAFRKAIEINPKLTNVWISLGLLLHDQRDRNDEAETALREAIKNEPGRSFSWNVLGEILSTGNRFEDAEACYRKAIELDPISSSAWNSLGNLLVDKLLRLPEAETAFRKVVEIEPSITCGFANLARTLAQLKRADEATDCYRKTVEVSDDSDQNLRLQAQLWLGNQDLALQALETLAQRASSGTENAFFQLKEQCFECHAIGLSAALVTLMQRSRCADFLQPFSLALRAANGETDAMLDVAVEVRAVAEDVLAQIKGKRA